MSDDVSFVEEIRRSPDDLVPRFIYADYLEDLGDPRGEFIRVQCQLSEMQPGTPGRSDLFNRERELLQEFGDQWLWPFQELGAKGLSVHSFERGLLERLQFTGTDWQANSTQICKIAPALRSLRLRQPLGFGDVDVRPSFPKHITELNLSSNQLTDEFVEFWEPALMFCDELTTLDVSRNSLGAAPLAMGAFNHVTDLRACFNSIDADALTNSLAGLRNAYGTSYPTHRLVALDLRGNPITDDGLEFLANDKWTQLTHLNLSSCGISSIAPLASKEHFPKLTHLILRDNSITSAAPNDNGAWGDLDPDQNTFLQNLKVLDLRNTAASANSHGI